MLTSIDRIDGLGVFEHYRKSNDIEDFGRFNIIYGLNGSGKTTLSRLFFALNQGQSETYPNLKYKINSSDGSFEQGRRYPTKIRVFNTDYVNSNIGEIEGQLNPIFIVGEENKSLVTQIEKDSRDLERLREEHDKKNREIVKLRDGRGKAFTEVAKLIASDISGHITRTYRKPDAEKAYEEIIEAQVLNDTTLNTHRSTLRQNSLEKVPSLNLGKVVLEKNDQITKTCPLDAISVIFEKTKKICLQTSDSMAIKQLQENPSIAAWVEQGLSVHRTTKSDICEYCLQPIPEDRLEALRKHFNDSDRSLKQKIEEIIGFIDKTVSSLEEMSNPIALQLYEEFQTSYLTSIKSLESAREMAIEYLNAIRTCLTDKLQRRTESFDCGLDMYEKTPFEDAVKCTDEILKRHNQKTDEFKTRAQEAKNAIELHHLSSLKPDIDEYDANIRSIENDLKVIVEGDSNNGIEGIRTLEGRISENRSKVSNTTRAAKQLTKLLKTFLGRNDLSFEPEKDGYRIMRGSNAVRNLSEGEKTAIAFTYFIVQLTDQDFNLEEGIVVIDDPISSLDSNSMYQAFSFLKNEVKDVKQIFLLTHNFNFLRLLLNWCKNIPKTEGKKSFYMLLCNLQNDGSRTSFIQPLDKELSENESEYAYLFKQLYNFRSDGTIAGSYPVPNIARKVLETFLDFYYPGTGSLYKQLEHVDFNRNKKASLFRFTNDLSHATRKGFDPALVPETEKNVTFLLEMIEEVSPVHYESLKKLIGEA